MVTVKREAFLNLALVLGLIQIIRPKAFCNTKNLLASTGRRNRLAAEVYIKSHNNGSESKGW